MTTPSPIGPGEQIENLAQRHRHGKGWGLQEEGAAGYPIPSWVEWLIAGVIVAGLCWLLGWFIFGPLALLAWTVWG